MTTNTLSAMQRRDFLKLAGAASAAGLTRRALAESGRRFSIVIDAIDPVASTQPVRWAAEQLGNALKAKGAIVEDADHFKGAAFYVLVAGTGSTLASGFSHAESAALKVSVSLRAALRTRRPSSFRAATREALSTG